jgi:DUF2975 family protein
MQPAPRRRTWLGPIRVLLRFILVTDILFLPLRLIPNGELRVGTVMVGDIFGGDPYTHRNFKQLDLGDVTVMDSDRNYLHVLLYSLSHGLAFTIATIPMLWYAGRLIAQARDGDPFTPGMVRGLRRLGFLVLAGGLASNAVEYVAGRIQLDLVLPNDDQLRAWARLDQYPTLWWLIPGLVVLGFSEIVRRGVNLRTELDGVI